MKKAIFGIISALALTLSLASCKKGDDVSKRVDNPKTELYNDFKLENVKNGVDVIENVDTTKKDYFQIKIAENYKETMFVYKLDLDQYLTDENIKKNGSAVSAVRFNVLSFSGEITDAEKSTIISSFYNESNGIKKKIYGTFDVYRATGWMNEVSVKSAKTKFDEGTKNNVLAVLYIPAYIIRVKSSEVVLNAYTMMPVYYEVTTFNDNKFDSQYLNEYSIKTLTFNSNNLLESN